MLFPYCVSVPSPLTIPISTQAVQTLSQPLSCFGREGFSQPFTAGVLWKCLWVFRAISSISIRHFKGRSCIIDGLILTDMCMQCFLTLITFSFFLVPPSLFSIVTMSGRWPASILSQAYPHKTTASLSSTNSKPLVFAFRMPLGCIFWALHYAVATLDV